MYMDALAKMGVGGAHPGGISLTEELLQNEKIDSQTRILDVGCGTGLTSFYLYQKFHCKVTACDTHPIMIKKANKRFEKFNIPIEATYGNAEKLPYIDQSFDYIISESVTTFTNIKKSIHEYHRVLKPQGKLLAIEMTYDGSLSQRELIKLKKFYSLDDILTLNRWEKMLNESQFSQVQIKPYQIEQNNTDTNNDYDSTVSTNDWEIHDIILEHEKLALFYQQQIFPSIITGKK